MKFLSGVRCILQPGDSLLLGTDLEKSGMDLIRAYDDELGVTAAFNLNLLSRINRELGADFKISEFEHEARINPVARSVEMHLRSLRRQIVTIPAAELVMQFEEGETIWTESSHKYALDEIHDMARRAGFCCEVQWVDQECPFSENLMVAE